MLNSGSRGKKVLRVLHALANKLQICESQIHFSFDRRLLHQVLVLFVIADLEAAL